MVRGGYLEVISTSHRIDELTKEDERSINKLSSGGIPGHTFYSRRNLTHDCADIVTKKPHALCLPRVAMRQQPDIPLVDHRAAGHTCQQRIGVAHKAG